MYVCGLVIPVPEDKIDAYTAWAESGARFFKEYGCLEIVESWEDFVPDGKQYRTSASAEIAAKPGEKIVFTLRGRTSASFEAAEERMHQDLRMGRLRRTAVRRLAIDPRVLPAAGVDGPDLSGGG